MNIPLLIFPHVLFDVEFQFKYLLYTDVYLSDSLSLSCFNYYDNDKANLYRCVDRSAT